MKKVFIFFALMLFFACDKNEKTLDAYYYVKNTSNQTISFDVTVLPGEPVGFFGEAAMNGNVYTFTMNANDSVIFFVDRTWDDLNNHPNWFTKFDIKPVEGIQMNDPYLPENWVKYNNTLDPPGYGDGYGYTFGAPISKVYLFDLNNENLQ